MEEIFKESPKEEGLTWMAVEEDEHICWEALSKVEEGEGGEGLPEKNQTLFKVLSLNVLQEAQKTHTMNIVKAGVMGAEIVGMVLVEHI